MCFGRTIVIGDPCELDFSSNVTQLASAELGLVATLQCASASSGGPIAVLAPWDVCARANCRSAPYKPAGTLLPGQTLLAQLTLERNLDQDCARPVLDVVRLNLSCCMLTMHHLAHIVGRAALAKRQE